MLGHKASDCRSNHSSSSNLLTWLRRPENHPSGVAFAISDICNYQTWQDIRQFLATSPDFLFHRCQRHGISVPFAETQVPPAVGINEH